MGKSDRVNCAACNKSLKKIRRYYRDGKFWCNKKCYKQAKQKEESNSQ